MLHLQHIFSKNMQIPEIECYFCMFSDLKIMQLHTFFHIHDSNFETPLSIFAMPCVLLNDDVMLAHI